MTTTVQVRYHGQPIDVLLPDAWRVLAVASPADASPIADIDAATVAVLRAPVGAPALAIMAHGARSVVIAVDDQTRPTPAGLVLPAIRRELNAAGVPDSACTVVVAKGTHSWPTDAQVREKIGDEIAEAWRVVVHDPDDATQLVLVGTTSHGTPVNINRAFVEADVRIGVGTCVAHYMAGYGGGPKIVLPGVSGRQTIIADHLIAAGGEAIQGRTTGNPMYEDLLEAARLARLDLKVDLVLDIDNRPVAVVAGEVEAGHRAAIAAYDRVYGFQAPAPADVIVASGYPLESELLQSCKAVGAADMVTRAGGTIILLSACSGGAGPGFGEALAEKPTPAEVWEWVRTGKTLPTGGPITARLLEILQTKRVVVVTDGLSEDSVLRMGFEYAPTPEAAIALVASRVPNADVIVLPAGSAINPLRVAAAV
jgi:nickel-dependent lactate racemase